MERNFEENNSNYQSSEENSSNYQSSSENVLLDDQIFLRSIRARERRNERRDGVDRTFRWTEREVAWLLEGPLGLVKLMKTHVRHKLDEALLSRQQAPFSSLESYEEEVSRLALRKIQDGIYWMHLQVNLMLQHERVQPEE